MVKINSLITKKFRWVLTSFLKDGAHATGLLFLSFSFTISLLFSFHSLIIFHFTSLLASHYIKATIFQAWVFIFHSLFRQHFIFSSSCMQLCLSVFSYFRWTSIWNTWKRTSTCWLKGALSSHSLPFCYLIRLSIIIFSSS